MAAMKVNWKADQKVDQMVVMSAAWWAESKVVWLDEQSAVKKVVRMVEMMAV